MYRTSYDESKFDRKLCGCYNKAYESSSCEGMNKSYGSGKDSSSLRAFRPHKVERFLACRHKYCDGRSTCLMRDFQPCALVTEADSLDRANSEGYCPDKNDSFNVRAGRECPSSLISNLSPFSNSRERSLSATVSQFRPEPKIGWCQKYCPQHLCSNKSTVTSAAKRYNLF